LLIVVLIVLIKESTRIFPQVWWNNWLGFLERENALPVFFHVYYRPAFLRDFIKCFIKTAKG